MNPTVRSHHAVLDLNTRLYLRCLEGVIDADGVGRVTQNTNSLAFIAVHLMDARHFLATGLGLELVNPFADTPAHVRRIDDAERLPTLAELRDAWVEVSGPLADHLAALDDDALSAPAPQQFPVEDDSLLGEIAFLLQHEAFHIGQMAFLRKQLGYAAMSYDATQNGESHDA